MTLKRPQNFAAKATNQYRSRDIFAYFGLRYCVACEAAKLDEWAENIATHVVFGTSRGRYLSSFHFKAINDKGMVEHRNLSVPGPTEALAEAVLLSRCAVAWSNESSPSYSYNPTSKADRKSYFKNYMDGLRHRQDAIADACRSKPEAEVVYVDIKKFYDSISIGDARKAWGAFCNKHDLESIHKDLGFKLIYNYSQHNDNKSILTGPMFCHFLANLVLRPIDEICENLNVDYVRYVDDLTFIGSSIEIDQAIAKVSEALDKLGMTLHSLDDPKTLRLSAREWLESTDDFKSTEDSLRWMRLVGNIKKNLLWNRGNNIELEDALISSGFRFPLPDYSAAIQELSAFEKIKTFGLWNWLFHRSRGATIPRIIDEAEQLRNSLEDQAYAIFGQSVADISKFRRKRLVSKLRYRLGRLVYLSTDETLCKLAILAKDWPELHLQAALLRAITTRDCSELIELGTNSAQAGAQIFRAMSETIKLSQPVESPAAIQGLATLILNGVSIEGTIRSQNAPVLRFAQGPIDADLVRQPRGLIQELASLHGIGETRHAETIRTAFDVDQEITLDALEFDYEYYI